jgi:ribosome-binding protein aMBF1 (putative translation factor)
MRARFEYITRLIEEFGLEVHEPRQISARTALGSADERQRRHLAGDLRYGHGPASRCRSRLREEAPEDAWQRNRVGPATSKGDRAMTKVRDLHKKWMKEPAYRQAHEALAPEFEIVRALIRARVQAGLTQEQLAKRMATTQSVVARLESGRTRPSTQTLERLAAATGTRLKISFEPAQTRS